MSAWEARGKSDDWYTPKYIFDALGCEFDLDVAAPPEGPRHVPTKRWFSERALEKTWRGFVWVNPPYGAPGDKDPWLAKLAAHGNGIALVPDRTSAPWFHAQVPKFHFALFVRGKIKFERPDGSIGGQPGNGTVLLSVGRRGNDALLQANLAGLGMLMEIA